MWDEANDTGHKALMVDMEILLEDTKDFQFHDYKNEKYPAPKLALVNRLNELAQNAKNGKYDNEITETN